MKSALGFLTLQVTATILAILYWLIGACSFVVNIRAIEDTNVPPGLFVVLVFVALMTGGGILMFATAYNQTQKISTAAFSFITALTSLWLLICVITFCSTPNSSMDFCVHQRCPESFWFASLQYKVNRKIEREPDEHCFTSNGWPETTGLETTTATEPFEDDKGGARRFDNLKNKLSGVNCKKNEPPKRKIKFQEYADDQVQDYTNYDSEYEYVDKYSSRTNKDTRDNIPDDKKGVAYKFGPEMIGAFVIFVLNFAFLIFSINAAWSYRKEILSRNLLHSRREENTPRLIRSMSEPGPSNENKENV